MIVLIDNVFDVKFAGKHFFVRYQSKKNFKSNFKSFKETLIMPSYDNQQIAVSDRNNPYRIIQAYNRQQNY